MKAYFKALIHAIGIRRFVVGSTVSLIVSLYGHLRQWLGSVNLWVPPDVESWKLALFTFLVFLGWWLLGRIVELEKEIEPQLDIVFRPESPFVITEPMNKQGHAIRLVRIQVINKSVRNLENCLVKLENIRRLDKPNFANRFTPVGLITQHQLLQRREGGVFNLRGKEDKLVEVAFLDETKKKSEIGLQYEYRGYPNPIPRGSYELTIKAYGGGDPVERKFKLSVSKDGYLSFQVVNGKRV